MFLSSSSTSITTWLIPIALGIILGLLIASRKNNDYTKIIYLEPEEFRLNMRKGQLLDIRKDDEFKKGRINGSRNFPKRSAFQNLHLLRNDQAIFLYADKDHGMIKSVAKKFIKKGYSPVYILKGGFENWEFTVKK